MSVSANSRSTGQQRPITEPLTAGPGQRLETEVITTYDPEGVPQFYRQAFTLITSGIEAGSSAATYTFQRVVNDAPPADMRPADEFARFLTAAVTAARGRWKTVSNGTKRIAIGLSNTIWLSLDEPGRVYAWDSPTKTEVVFDTRLKFTDLYPQVSAAANAVGSHHGPEIAQQDKYAALRGCIFDRVVFADRLKMPLGQATDAINVALRRGEVERAGKNSYRVIAPLLPPDEATEPDAPQGVPADRRINGTPASPPKIVPQDERIPDPAPKWFILYRQAIEARLSKANNLILELESAIMDSKYEHNRALSIYGSENALEEVTRQVSIAPQFKDLTAEEHRFVAGVGLASGLNPVFHLHAWIQDVYDKKTKQTVRTMHITPDYKALMASVDDPIMLKERRLTPDEMRDRGIPENEIASGAIAYVVEGHNLKHAIMARQAGLEYEPNKGYGWWAAQKDKEIWATNDKSGKRYNTGKVERIANDTPNARDGEWVAKKRAMRDLYNQLADLRLKFAEVPGVTVKDDEWIMGGSGSDLEIVDGEVIPQPIAAWLNDAARVTAAEKWSASQGVTDAEINAQIDADDWRQSLVEDDEFRALVERVITLRSFDAETGEQIEGNDADEPEAMHDRERETTQDAETVKCANCGIDDAQPDNPVSATLCATCAQKQADSQAAAS